MTNRFDNPGKARAESKGKDKPKKRSFMNRLVGAIPEPVRITPGDVGRIIPKPVRSAGIRSAGAGLNVLSKPGQAVRSGLVEIAESSYEGQLPTQALLDGLNEGAQGLVGKEHATGTEVVSSMLSGRRDKIKKLPFGVQTAVEIVLDPTSYVTLGASGAAKAGLTNLGDAGLKEAAEKIAKDGLRKGLTSAEKAKVKQGLVDHLTTKGRSVEKATKIADKQMRAMARSARGGVKFAGHSVPGLTAQSKIGQAAAKVNPKTVAGKAIASTDTGAKLKGLFVKGATAERELGRGGVDRLNAELRRSKDLIEAEQSVAHRAAENLARAAGASEEDLLEIGRALDVSPERNALHSAVKATARDARKASNEADHWSKRAVDTYEAAQRKLDEARMGVDDAKAAYEDAAAKYGTPAFDPKAVKALGTKLSVANRKLVNAAKAAEKGADTRQGVAQVSRVLTDQAKAKGLAHSEAVGVLKDDNPAAALAARYRAEGKDALADIVDFADKQRRAFTEEQVARGLLRTTHEVETYLPRYATPEFKKAMERNAEAVAVALSGKGKTLTSQELNRLLKQGEAGIRQLRPDLSIQQINDHLVSKGILKAGEKAFEDNPLVSLLTRKNHAVAAREMYDMLGRLEGVVDDKGRPLVQAVEAGGKVEPNFTPLLDESTAEVIGKRYFVHPEAKKLLNEMAAVTTNDESLKALQKLTSDVTKVWKGMATFGPAFHARNEVGNLWLNFLGGVTNPATYAKAARLQTKFRKAMKALGPDADFDAALGSVKGLSDEDVFALRTAWEKGVINRGFFEEELAGKLDNIAPGRKPGRTVRALRGLNDANRAAGSAIENNARLTHYLYKLDTLGDPDLAAESVKKYLFDYSDLTKAEERFRKVIPFYTFMRKNLPVQVEAMVTQPGKITAYGHAKDDAMDHGVGYVPDVPLNSAEQTLRILTGAPDAASKTDDPLAIRAQAAVGMIHPGIKAATDTASMGSSFSGIPLRDNESIRENLLTSLLPPVGKVQRAKDQSLLQSVLGLKNEGKYRKPKAAAAPKGKAPKKGNRFD